jgi:phenylacetate-CoA ligase
LKQLFAVNGSADMIQSKFLILAELLRNEYRSSAELSQLREQKLRRLVDYAYSNVPFYHEKFRQAGVKPEDIRTPADLGALPVLRKAELIEEDPLRIRNPAIPPHALVERRTSGSSGAPFKFYVDRNFDQFRKAQFLRPYMTNGRKILDRSLTVSARAAPPKKWFQRMGLMQNLVVPCHLEGDELLRQYSNARPDVVSGYPSTLSVLAEAILSHPDPVNGPRLVFTDSELLTGFIRERLRSAFNAPVIDIFGTIETENIAWQCGEDSDYHYASDCVILETVRDGKQTDPDEPGSLVCTVLNSLTTPFIRYEIGDLVTLSTRRCSCGRTLPLISSIDGRQMDQLVLPNGSQVSPMSLGLSDVLAGTVREYQIIQESLEDFTFLLVLREPLSEEQEGFIRHLTTTISPIARVKIKNVDSIPRESSGKRRTFVSRVR